MNFGAVLTGDMVKSTKLNLSDREKSKLEFKNSFREINRLILNNIGMIEFYRGDSFQIVIPKIEKSLLISILLRAKLRAFKPSSFSVSGGKNKEKPILKAWSDARISVGIGSIADIDDNIFEWQGEAFNKSGKFLDEKLTGHRRLWVNTPWIEINEELEVEIGLLDALIGHWTEKTAETMYRYLLYRENQSELAAYFKISQPSVNRRLIRYGNSDVIDYMLKRYSKLVNTNL